MAKNEICCEEIVTVKEKTRSIEMVIDDIKQDLDDVKKTLNVNGTKLDDLIDNIKADKATQLKFLFLIITMCASFGVFLTKSAFDSRRDITVLQYQYSYEQSHETKGEYVEDKVYRR